VLVDADDSISDVYTPLSVAALLTAPAFDADVPELISEGTVDPVSAFDPPVEAGFDTEPAVDALAFDPPVEAGFDTEPAVDALAFDPPVEAGFDTAGSIAGASVVGSVSNPASAVGSVAGASVVGSETTEPGFDAYPAPSAGDSGFTVVSAEERCDGVPDRLKSGGEAAQQFLRSCWLYLPLLYRSQLRLLPKVY